MKISKHLICPDRLRRVPQQFSWIDQRLVRDGYVQRCTHCALALYLVLVTVSDSEGLSYYSEASLQRMLRIGSTELMSVREQLCQVGLIAYQSPLYQVFSLDRHLAKAGFPKSEVRSGEVLPAGEILRRILGGVA